ncbi:MAG: YibE/F family protein [Clostridia bacterium]|nr:YibE/F family protein [Clostridia bacterium]
MKKILLIILTLLFMFPNLSFADEYELERTMEKGEVIAIEEEDAEQSFISKVQLVTVEILTGEHKGETVLIENYLSDSYVMDIEVELHQKVLLSVETYQDGTVEYYIASEVRDTYIYWLLIAFAFALLMVGRLQGLKTIFTLFVTVFFIFMVELPLLLRGYNAVLVTVVVAIFITVITVSVISGLTKKSFAAIVGTTLGVMIAGGLSIFISHQVKLTGMTSDEAIMLLNVQGVTFNFQHLLFSAILLGALGAIMDVAMSIASSIDELHNVNASLSMKSLFKSGMRVGRDIMGTMSNTLILAYTGSMLPLLLLFMANNDSLIRMINLDVIATEVIRSIAGSIGLVLTIPITAVISVALIKDYRFHVGKSKA